jgi:hypothetical protein
VNYNYSERNDQGQSILHIASKEGNKELILEIFEILRNKNRDSELLALIVSEDVKKWTPVYHAIDCSESGFPEIVGIIFLHI